MMARTGKSLKKRVGGREEKKVQFRDGRWHPLSWRLNVWNREGRELRIGPS